MNKEAVTFGLVQFPVVKGAIDLNLENHVKHVALASSRGADVVVFPELSLTGYEPELAGALAIDINARPLEALSAAAREYGVVVISGCPVKSAGARPYIGALVCFPTGETEIYRKQHLHPGESDYFSPGKGGYCFQYKGQKIAVAVCADFSHPAHPAEAGAANAEVYLASAMISHKGFDVDSEMLQSHAVQHDFVVLLSNHNSVTGGWNACGKSRGWNRRGELMVASDSQDSSIVFCSVVNGQVSGKVVKI